MLDLIGSCLTLLDRMKHTGKLFLVRVRLIESRQQHHQKSHIIVEQCLPLRSAELTEISAQSAVIGLVYILVLFRQLFAVYIDIAKHNSSGL